MPPRDVLDSLWAEVRTDRPPLQTAIQAPAIPYRNAPRNRPPTQIAPNGMTIRPPQPFRNSLRGGSDDLAEAAAMKPDSSKFFGRRT